MLYSLIMNKENTTACITLHAEEVLHIRNGETYSDNEEDLGNVSSLSNRMWDNAKIPSKTTLYEILLWLESNEIERLIISFEEITSLLLKDELIEEKKKVFSSILKNCSENQIFLVYINIASTLIDTLLAANTYPSINHCDFTIDSKESQSGVTRGNEKGLVYTKNYAGVEERFLEAICEFNYLRKDYIEECVQKSTIDGTLNESAPSIILSKYIDTKLLFESGKNKFFLVYLLAREIVYANLELQKGKIKSKLMFYTLNGCLIATLIGNMLGLDILCIDHLGPIYRFFRSPQRIYINNEKYLLIADVICTGSEVSRAKCIVEAYGGTILGYASLVDIGIATDENEKRPYISVYNVLENDNKINYTIKTRLCKGCKRENEERG